MLKRRIVLSAAAAWMIGCVEQPTETQEIIDNLIQAGFPADDIMAVGGRVYVGRDVEVSLEASREMLRPSSSGKEQYRTNNTVSNLVAKICVDGSTFTGVFGTALDLAIQNYEDLPLSFAMARTPSYGCSFTITAVIVPGSAGGQAGFPSDGLPYPTIRIHDGLATYSVDTIEHVITHELGHTIGLRHTDFYDRGISCGGAGGNEGEAGVGAIYIPETPTTATVGGSVMNSCFRTYETGELTSSDRTALQMLYGLSPFPDILQRLRWATQQGSFWDTQQWVRGDFNGDAKVDLANVFNDGGAATIDVHLSRGGSFGIARWATQQGSFWDTQKWVAGDFNGDGKADLANVLNDGGWATIDVHLSTGSSFGIARWATRQGSFWDTQKWVAGDFNGDGKVDLANVLDDGGWATIDVHLSTGSSFTRQRWTTQQGSFWDAQQWLAGDFNGDGKVDLANVFSDNSMATIDVHLSTGSSFTRQRWVTQQGGFWDTQKWLAGDFNGDGKADVTKVFSDGGAATIDVHLSTGSSFSMQRWATQQGSFWDTQKWLTGDFTGDGKADLANVFGDYSMASIDIYRPW